MVLDRDRKLDLLGKGLAVLIVASIGLLGYSALLADSAGPAAPPEANWTVERVNDSHVELRHDGGSTVRSEALSVTVNGRERPTPFDGLVRADDAATMPIAPGQTVRLYWIGDGNSREPLYQADV